MKKIVENVAVGLIAALLLPASVMAQESLTLNKADFTTPAWTQIVRTVAKAQPASMPFSINTTYNGNPQTQMAFAWFTSEEVKTGSVQLLAKTEATEADFATATTLNATSTTTPELNYSIAKNYLEGVEPGQKVKYTSHKALATGLTPATTYSYRVGNANGWSEIGHFRTADPTSKNFSFIYITDTQAQNDEMFRVSAKTVHTAREMVPEASFCLVNGDLIETSGDNNAEWEDEQWFATMQDVWLSLPLVPIQGNHDTSVNGNWGWHFNTDRSFNETSAVPTAMPGTVYSFVQGDVLFLVINYEDYKKDGYFDALANWMRTEVEAHKDVKWRVATFHKNMFTGSKSHQSDADGKLVREHMLPVFSSLGINIALQGHDHIYEVIGPVNLTDKTLIADEVGGVESVEPVGVRENMTGKQGGVFNVENGTLFFLNNSAGKKKYEPRNEQDMIAAYSDHEVENYWGLFSGKFGQTGEPTFSRVSVTEDTISFDTYTVDDKGNATLFDSFKAVKGQPAGPDAITAAKQSPVAITYDKQQQTVVATGADADSLEVFTADGKAVSPSNLTAGLYLARVKAQGRTFTAKIRI